MQNPPLTRFKVNSLLAEVELGFPLVLPKPGFAFLSWFFPLPMALSAYMGVFREIKGVKVSFGRDDQVV